MAGTLNKVMLIGNVGGEPEIKYTQDNKEIAKFSIATTESWKDKITNERKEKTEWHRIAVFIPQLVNIVKKYIHKGSKIYVEGALQTRHWKDQQSGNDKYITEILLQSFNSILILLDSRSTGSIERSENFGSESQLNATPTITPRQRQQDGDKKEEPEDFDVENLKGEDVPF